MAAEGPYRGWYLAAEDPSPRQTHRRLRLVRHRKDATAFEYVQDNYFVGHK